MQTPSGLSRITHTLDAAPAGGCLYAKRLEARRDKTGALGDWMLRMMLRGAVKREVERAAKVADEAG